MKLKSTGKLSAAVLGLATIFFASDLVVHSQDSNAGTNAVAATVSAKPIPYPFDHCLISGDKFGGDMGDPEVFIYTNNGANQEIKFCCSMCKPKFLKDPDKYMKIIQQAEAAQKK